MAGWDDVIDGIEAFIVKYPMFEERRRGLTYHVLSKIAPWSEKALELAMLDDIEGLTEREKLIRHLNISAPQSEAHHRTMMGGLDCVLVYYRDSFLPTIKLVEEVERSERAKPLPCALSEKVEDSKVEESPAFDPPQPKKRGR